MPDHWNPHEILARLILALQRAVGGQRYRVTSMEQDYTGEEIPGNKIWDGTHVKYLTKAERAAYALTFRDGYIWHADGNLFDTTSADSLHTGFGRAIFVMDADGNFYAAKDQIRGEFHHSSLVAGAPVAAAGELEVVRGVLIALSDRSGHYLPSRRFTDQAIDEFKKKNISFQAVKLDLVCGS
jgi:hypothetical protein